MKLPAFVLILIILASLLFTSACDTHSNSQVTVENSSNNISSTTTPGTFTTTTLLSSKSEFGELSSLLENNEQDTFAGCWLDKTGFVVCFTCDGEQIINKYVVPGSPLANAIELRTMKYTLKTLNDIQMSTQQTLESLDLFCSTNGNIKENLVEVYVTDDDFFYNTLNQANVQLPEQVRVIVTYEPLRSISFPITPVIGVHFPQLKMNSGIYMACLLKGQLALKNGYLYVGNSIIVWQPDFFLNDNHGTIEVLNRDGKVVARVGEEVEMGGGGIDSINLNRMLKEPLPANCKGPFFLQGGDVKLADSK